MFLDIVIDDVKEKAEELLTYGMACHQVYEMSFAAGIVNSVLKWLYPIVMAYVVHLLKKNYWERNRPFMKNFAKDIFKSFKKKNKK